MNEHQMHLNLRPSGEELRDLGCRRVAITSQEWSEKAAKAIEKLRRDLSTFTADELLELTGPPPHPNAVGAAFRTAARARKIMAVGYDRSTNPSRHAGTLRVWRGAF